MHIKINGTRKRRHHPYQGRKMNKNSRTENKNVVPKETNQSLAEFDTAADSLVNPLEKLTKYKKD